MNAVDIGANGVLTKRQIYTVFAGVMTGLSLSALDGTIVNTALPTIVGELGGLEQIAWVGTAYLLTSTAATPLFGKLSDLYGRRVLFQVAIVVFLIGSVLAAMSQTLNQLITSRGLQGVGGGGLMAMAFVIIGDVVPPRERGRYTGFITATFAGRECRWPPHGRLLRRQPHLALDLPHQHPVGHRRARRHDEGVAAAVPPARTEKWTSSAPRS